MEEILQALLQVKTSLIRPQNNSQNDKHKQMGLCDAKKLLHSKRDNKQVTKRMGKNIYKLCI